jgi:hypothetical protein
MKEYKKDCSHIPDPIPMLGTKLKPSNDLYNQTYNLISGKSIQISNKYLKKSSRISFVDASMVVEQIILSFNEGKRRTIEIRLLVTNSHPGQDKKVFYPSYGLIPICLFVRSLGLGPTSS